MSTSTTPAPAHPGVILQSKFLSPMSVTVPEAAAVLGVPESMLTEVVKGNRAVDVELAHRLAHYVGDSAAEWLHRQQVYDLEGTPAPVFEGLKLESAYWGRFVGLFTCTTQIREGKSVDAIVAVAFSDDGAIVLTLADQAQTSDSSVSFYYEHSALTAVRKLLTPTSQTAFSYCDDAGIEYVRARLRRGLKELGEVPAYLGNLSGAARVRWLDYVPRKLSQVGRVCFSDNSPNWATFYRDGEVSKEVGPAALSALRKKLKELNSTTN